MAAVDQTGRDDAFPDPRFLPTGNPSHLVIPPPSPGCADANLQTTAVATSSGGGAGIYGPALAANGVFGPPNMPQCCVSGNCWNWVSAPNNQTTSTAWLLFTWATPVTICQVWADTKAPPAECGAGIGRLLSGADVQTWDGAAYVTHGTVTGQLDDWNFNLPSCITTTRLRLFRLYVDPAAGGQTSNPIIYEVKVYGCQSGPTPTPTPTPTPSPTPTPGNCPCGPELALIETKLDANAAANTAQAAAHAAHSTAVGQLETKLDANAAANTAQAAAHAAHAAAIAQLETKLDANAANNTTQNTAIGALETKADSLATAMSSVETAVSNMETALADLPCQMYRLLHPRLPGRPSEAGSRCLGLLPSNCANTPGCAEQPYP